MSKWPHRNVHKIQWRRKLPRKCAMHQYACHVLSLLKTWYLYICTFVPQSGSKKYSMTGLEIGKIILLHFLSGVNVRVKSSHNLQHCSGGFSCKSYYVGHISSRIGRRGEPCMTSKSIHLCCTLEDIRRYPTPYVQPLKYLTNFQTKPLGVIWGKFEEYNSKNTIMFDDLRRNFLMNPQNGLKVMNKSEYWDFSASETWDSIIRAHKEIWHFSVTNAVKWREKWFPNEEMEHCYVD